MFFGLALYNRGKIKQLTERSVGGGELQQLSRGAAALVGPAPASVCIALSAVSSRVLGLLLDYLGVLVCTVKLP